jgi:hypothetical protein
MEQNFGREDVQNNCHEQSAVDRAQHAQAVVNCQSRLRHQGLPFGADFGVESLPIQEKIY